MTPHSSTLAWKIPWMEDPGRLQSMGSLRVGHDWATSLSLLTFMHWRKWQPTPVFLPGESQGRGSLVGCRLWGHTELDTTEATWQQQQHTYRQNATWTWRRLSTSQGEKSRTDSALTASEEANLLTPQFQPSTLQHCETMKFSCLSELFVILYYSSPGKPI